MPQLVKSHGLGNDYVVVDPARLPFAITPAAVRLICDRHYGVGADGLLVLAAPAGGDFGLRIYNPDGSEAEKSGNGIRIFAKYLREHGYTTRDRFRIDTPGGRVLVECALRDGRVAEVTADMGTATFDARETLEVAGATLRVSVLSLGNPHCVVLVDDLGAVETHRLGPLIERHPVFPARTNVQLAQVLARDRVRIEIWERGAGYTLGSGTSACAAAAACHRAGHVGRELTVTMPGGDLAVTIDDGYAMRLRGPVEEVFVGELGPELVRRLTELP